MDWWLNFFSNFGPFLSGASIFMGAIIAACTLVLHHLRVREDAIFSRSSDLYKRFWDPHDYSFKAFRVWIDIDVEYNKRILPAKEILLTLSAPRHLTKGEKELIQTVDRFCAIMLEAYYIRNSARDKGARRIVNAMFLNY